MGDVPWPRVGSSALTACLVAVPLAVGFATGHSVAGGIGALGAYLWTASHITDKRPIGLPIGVVTILLLGLAGATGALGGRYLWFLVLMVVLWATAQAVTDVAGGPLRVPVALSALCMLLSAIGGGHTITGSLWQGLLTLGGAAWITGTELVRHPPWRSPGPVASVGFQALGPAWPKARGFALLLVIPTALVAGIAGTFQIAHGAWTATTVLRVPSARRGVDGHPGQTAGRRNRRRCHPGCSAAGRGSFRGDGGGRGGGGRDRHAAGRTAPVWVVYVLPDPDRTPDQLHWPSSRLGDRPHPGSAHPGGNGGRRDQRADL